MILAVLEARLRIPFAGLMYILNVAGGMKNLGARQRILRRWPGAVECTRKDVALPPCRKP